MSLLMTCELIIYFELSGVGLRCIRLWSIGPLDGLEQLPPKVLPDFEGVEEAFSIIEWPPCL